MVVDYEEFGVADADSKETKSLSLEDEDDEKVLI